MFTTNNPRRFAMAALLLSMLSLLACSEVESDRGQISVTGTGSAALAPDMAIVNLTVVREAATAKQAVAESSEAMTAVQSAMADLGIEGLDLQTSSFSIQPVYQNVVSGDGGRQQRKITGYSARNGLAVRVRDLGRLGEVIDHSVSLGVNEGGNIRFTNADPSSAVEEARKEAVRDARGKAKTLARAAKVKLDDVLSISEHSHAPRPTAMDEAVVMRSASVAVPIAAGENTYTVIVNMTYAIDD
ncbi:MAG: SIMPL domain-containing protein [Pseudomonadota bacterium]